MKHLATFNVLNCSQRAPKAHPRAQQPTLMLAMSWRISSSASSRNSSSTTGRTCRTGQAAGHAPNVELSARADECQPEAPFQTASSADSTVKQFAKCSRWRDNPRASWLLDDHHLPAEACAALEAPLTSSVIMAAS